MYAERELKRLATVKAALRWDIARNRQRCVVAARRVAQPLAWVDRLLAWGRRVAPFAALAAVPLGFLLRRSPAARPRLLGTLLRWAPVVFGAVRGFAAARSRATGSTRPHSVPRE